MEGAVLERGGTADAAAANGATRGSGRTWAEPIHCPRQTASPSAAALSAQLRAQATALPPARGPRPRDDGARLHGRGARTRERYRGRRDLRAGAQPAPAFPHSRRGRPLAGPHLRRRHWGSGRQRARTPPRDARSAADRLQPRRFPLAGGDGGRAGWGRAQPVAPCARHPRRDGVPPLRPLRPDAPQGPRRARQGARHERLRAPAARRRRGRRRGGRRGGSSSTTAARAPRRRSRHATMAATIRIQRAASPPDVPPHAASSSNSSAPPQPLEPPPLDTNSSGGASSLSSVTPAPSWLYPLAAILGGAGHGADPQICRRRLPPPPPPRPPQWARARPTPPRARLAATWSLRCARCLFSASCGLGC